MNNWVFGVKTYPIQIVREDGNILKPEEFQAVVHESEPIVFYVGSQKYLPIPHPMLMHPLIQKIDQQKFIFDILTTHNGGRMYATILNNRFNDIPKLGKIKYGVKIVNSLDGSKRLEIHSVLLREVCSNGMVATRILGGVRRRHLQSVEITVDTVDHFVTQVITLLSNTKILDNLEKLLIPVTKETFEHILTVMEMPQKYADKCREIWEMPEITSITPEERETAWGIYNIISYVLTHETVKMSLDRQHNFSVELDRQIAKLIA